MTTMETMQSAANHQRSLKDLLAEELMLARGDEASDKDTAERIMNLLLELGHYVPGAPPARQILDDAQSFAGRLILATLALRVLDMLDKTQVVTPETRPTSDWIKDYVAGRGHGPAGAPMLWPRNLPVMASRLREWGYQPTPTSPAYVARAASAIAPTMQ